MEAVVDQEIPPRRGRPRRRAPRAPVEEPAPIPTASVLLVGSDPLFLAPLRECLEHSNYFVWITPPGPDALALARRCRPDVTILDLSPPEAEKLILCASFKTATSAPILLCSSSPHQWARAGLLLGAHDFIRKPLDFGELEGRLVCMLARSRQDAEGRAGAPSEARLEVGDLVIVPAQHRVTVGTASPDLTATEFRLLVALAGRPNTPVCREDLARLVWRNIPTSSNRLLDNHVRRLRKKLPAVSVEIRTVPGRGYMLASKRART